MGRLDIALLGPPLVRADGRLIAFPTRKAAALLFYLAASGELHPREQLAALLWPDSDEERARGTLRTTLAMLRRALGDEGAALFVAERDRIGLAPGAAIDTDLRAIEAAYALARREGAAVTPSAVAQLRAAAGRYRGDFLTGFSLSDAPEFDDWAAQQREVWHRRADLVFDRLSQDLFEGGEFVEAGEVTARWVAVDPLNEAAHRRLMRVYFATGDRAGALRAYEACRAALLSELQATPAPETAALAARTTGPALHPSPFPTQEKPNPLLLGEGRRRSGGVRSTPTPNPGLPIFPEPSSSTFPSPNRWERGAARRRRGEGSLSPLPSLFSPHALRRLLQPHKQPRK